MAFTSEFSKKFTAEFRKEFFEAGGKEEFDARFELMILESLNAGNQFYFFEVYLPCAFPSEVKPTWLNALIESYPLMDYVYVSTSVDAGGALLKGLMSIRTLFGKERDLTWSVKRLFVNDLSFTRKLEGLKEFSVIKTAFVEVVGDYQLERHMFYYFPGPKRQRGPYYDPWGYDFGEFLDRWLRGALPSKFTTIAGRPMSEFAVKVYDVSGMETSNKPELMILVIWRTFMTLAGLHVSGGSLYRKSSGGQYTFEVVADLRCLERKFEDIFVQLGTVFIYQMRGIDPVFLRSEGMKKAYGMVVADNKILPYIKVDHNLIEYKDGLYAIGEEVFISRRRVRELCNNINERRQTFGKLDFCVYSHIYADEDCGNLSAVEVSELEEYRILGALDEQLWDGILEGGSR